MKKRFLICCILCGLLVGCIHQEREEDVPLSGGQGESTHASISTSVPSNQVQADAAAARIAYYEALTKDLQAELLALKTELYTCRVTYEERIAELTGMGSEADERVFDYVIEDGKAILNAYRGTSTSLVLPQTLGGCPLVAIADGAFEDNARLTSVILPKGLEELGWFAFSGCVALQRVVVPESVTRIGYAAFNNCTASLTVIAPSGSYASDYAKSYGIRTASEQSLP